MNLDLAETRARVLINKHLGANWKFGWNRSRVGFGVQQAGRWIRLSRPLTELLPWSSVRHTLLHEIAHGLVFEVAEADDHGVLWREYAQELGLRRLSGTTAEEDRALAALKRAKSRR